MGQRTGAQDGSNETRESSAPVSHQIVIDGGPLERGRRLGDFRVEEPIRRGGMGVVYAAHQLSLDRPVALKVVTAERARDAAALTRFRREARASSRVSDSHLIEVYAVGEEDGVHFLAQELVPGGRHLGDLIEEWRTGSASPAEDRDRKLVEIIRDAARALGKVQRAGILHRDIKPSNLLLADGDDVRVCDFGLARLEGAMTITESGGLPGTPLYMSPEQVRQDRDAMGAASDVFSLGACLYEGLVLEPPFEGDSAASIGVRILLGEFEDPRLKRPDLDRRLAAVTLRALESDPARRYPTMHAFADDLDAILGGQPVRAKLPGPWRRSVRFMRTRPRARWAASAALVLTCAGLANVGLKALAADDVPIADRLRSGSIESRLATVEKIERSMRTSPAAHRDGVDQLTRFIRESQPRTEEFPYRSAPLDAPDITWRELNADASSDLMSERAPVTYAALRVLQERSRFHESDAELRAVDRRHESRWSRRQTSGTHPDETRRAVIDDLALRPVGNGADTEFQLTWIDYVRDAQSRFPEIASAPWIDFRGASLVGTKPDGPKLDLEGSTLSRADVSFSDFTDALLGRVDLSSALIFGARFAGADLREANFEHARVENTDFGGAKCAGSFLSKSTFDRCNFWQTHLQDSYLIEASLVHTLHMAGANLDRVVGWCAVFDGSNIGHADENVPRTTFRDAYLRGASFRNVSAIRVDLSNADLSATDWTNADLRWAILRGANLTDAILAGANLCGANFEGAVGLTPEQLAPTTMNVETRLPEK